MLVLGCNTRAARVISLALDLGRHDLGCRGGSKRDLFLLFLLSAQGSRHHLKHVPRRRWLAELAGFCSGDAAPAAAGA